MDKTVDITKFDSNFIVDQNVQRSDAVYRDITEEPFTVNGLIREENAYRRFTGDVAKTVSEGVFWGNTNTAGGRVRFCTDSPYIILIAKMPSFARMPHFALTGSSGFDLYEKTNHGHQYMFSFVPPYDANGGYSSAMDFPDRKMREITINFPTYSAVEQVVIGLSKDAQLKKCSPYKIEKPVVFYGSSITQGGCCSRPGNTYQQILSRYLDFDYINLGFSGCARAEQEIADYISGLSMSAFVYDYDHNAPNTEHLAATHEKMFKTIRRANPELPILMLTRPKYHLNSDEEKRLEIVRKTYENAVSSGDKNVYLIAGPDLISEEMIETATVDNCHPNDSGFLSMALAIKPVLAKMLNIETEN